VATNKHTTQSPPRLNLHISTARIDASKRLHCTLAHTYSSCHKCTQNDVKISVQYHTEWSHTQGRNFRRKLSSKSLRGVQNYRDALWYYCDAVLPEANFKCSWCY